MQLLRPRGDEFGIQVFFKLKLQEQGLLDQVGGGNNDVSYGTSGALNL